MRGNAPVPDFKLHTGAFALLLSYAKLKKTTVALMFQEASKRDLVVQAFSNPVSFAFARTGDLLKENHT